MAPEGRAAFSRSARLQREAPLWTSMAERRRLEGGKAVVVVLRMEALHVADGDGPAGSGACGRRRCSRRRRASRPSPGTTAMRSERRTWSSRGQPRPRRHRLEVAVARQEELAVERLQQLGAALRGVGAGDQVEHRVLGVAGASRPAGPAAARRRPRRSGGRRGSPRGCRRSRPGSAATVSRGAMAAAARQGDQGAGGRGLGLGHGGGDGDRRGPGRGPRSPCVSGSRTWSRISSGRDRGPCDQGLN